MKKANELLEQDHAANGTPQEEGVTLEEFSDSEEESSEEEDSSSEEEVGDIVITAGKDGEITRKGRNEMLLDGKGEEETGETGTGGQGLLAQLLDISSRPKKPLKHAARTGGATTAEEREVEAARARVGAGIVEME